MADRHRSYPALPDIVPNRRRAISNRLQRLQPCRIRRAVSQRFYGHVCRRSLPALRRQVQGSGRSGLLLRSLSISRLAGEGRGRACVPLLRHAGRHHRSYPAHHGTGPASVVRARCAVSLGRGVGMPRMQLHSWSSILVDCGVQEEAYQDRACATLQAIPPITGMERCRARQARSGLARFYH